MKLAWVTDPHLNFVSLTVQQEWMQQIRSHEVDGLLLTGDISEADDLTWQLQMLRDQVDVPVYFVLGNHDYYRGSIATVRDSVQEVCDSSNDLCYLTSSNAIALPANGSLCGVDGWADGRIGDYIGSPVRLNDDFLIEDLRDLTTEQRLRVVRRQATFCAVRLRQQLEQAREFSQWSIVLTHVPPFRESCWYEGRFSDDDWAPFFTCHTVGWTLKRFCVRYPDHSVLVLCGHTHGEGLSRLANNLCCWTAPAVYCEPAIANVFELREDQPFRKLFPSALDWSYQHQ